MNVVISSVLHEYQLRRASHTFVGAVFNNEDSRDDSYFPVIPENMIITLWIQPDIILGISQRMMNMIHKHFKSDAIPLESATDIPLIAIIVIAMYN